MATQYLYFKGEAQWCKVHEHQKDDKYKRYSINVLLDDESKERFKEAGIQTELKWENAKEKSGRQFHFFTRRAEQIIKGTLVNFGPPHIFLASDQKPEVEDTPRFEGNVGNGSIVTVKVAVFDTQKGKGQRLESVRVDELVEYNPQPDPGVDAPW